MNKYFNAERAFISAERSEYSDEVNHSRHLALGDQLRARGMTPVEVGGCYDGRRERAYSVLHGPAQLMYILDLANRWGQESVLVVNKFLSARLVIFTGSDTLPRVQSMGLFMPTTKPAAELSAYTIMPDGSTWTCVKNPFDLEAAMLPR